MSKVLRIDLFAEDRAHEEFLKPLIQRLAREEKCEIRLAVRSARGGHGRAIEEFKAYQRIISAGHSELQRPDVVCVAIDANCHRWTDRREEIARAVTEDFKDRVILACPDRLCACSWPGVSL